MNARQSAAAAFFDSAIKAGRDARDAGLGVDANPYAGRVAVTAHGDAVFHSTASLGPFWYSGWKERDDEITAAQAAPQGETK